MRSVLLSTVYTRRYWGPEKLTILPKITLLGSNRNRFQTKAVWFQSQHTLYCYVLLQGESQKSWHGKKKKKSVLYEGHINSIETDNKPRLRVANVLSFNDPPQRGKRSGKSCLILFHWNKSWGTWCSQGSCWLSGWEKVLQFQKEGSQGIMDLNSSYRITLASICCPSSYLDFPSPYILLVWLQPQLASINSTSKQW